MRTVPRLLYVVTEDWFFCSHFLPMARGAKKAGFEVVVACRVREKAHVLAAEGFRIIPVEAERGDKGLLSIFANAAQLGKILRRETPDIAHFISLRPVLLGGLVAKAVGVRNRVFAVTGLGPLNGPHTLRRRLAMLLVRFLVRAIGGKGSRFLFENRDDPPRLGLDPENPEEVCVVGGTGIDPEAFQPSREPSCPPLRAAIVSRMLWTKGIDAAVEAVTRARAAGVNVTLSLVGSRDPSNPACIPDEILTEWGKRPGIVWEGRVPDVADVWRTHHVAVLPSHGEGMPRMLIEAAACGRPMIATDVSGCRTLVRPGLSGFLVPVGDTGAIEKAFRVLAGDARLRARMGEAARATILAGYTEEQVKSDVVALYRRLME